MELKISEVSQLTRCFDMKLKIFEISIISYFFRDIGHRLTRPCTDTFAYIFGTWARKTNTFYFTESVRCFQLNKSVLETTETKQAGSQLHFAPKIIKIHSLVFENELVEDAIPVPKTLQN